MKTQQLDLAKFDVIELSEKENHETDGGVWPVVAAFGVGFLAIGAAAAAGTAIYGAGKAAGEFVYHATH